MRKLIEQDRERMRILEAAEAQAKAEAAEAAALEAEAAAAAAEAAALEAANAAETGDESMIEAVNPRWRRDPGDPTPRLASPVKAPRPAADPEQDGGGGEQGGGQGEAQPHDGEEAVPLQVAPLADVSNEPAASPAELVTPTKAAPETDGDEAVPQPAS